MRRTPTQPALHDGLMERVVERDNLRRAWRQVKANRGAPGIDGMTVDEFPACGTPAEALAYHGLDGKSLADRILKAVS